LLYKIDNNPIKDNQKLLKSNNLGEYGKQKYLALQNKKTRSGVVIGLVIAFGFIKILNNGMQRYTLFIKM
jgi:hypothetical protein